MTPHPPSSLHLGHGSHPGETGKNNEDCYAVTPFPGQGGGQTLTLAVVADGIGGNRAGEVASELAVQAMINYVDQSQGDDYRLVLERAMGHAARVIGERSQAQPEYRGMGTTCAAALIVGRRVFTVYVGDSRLYLARGGGIRQTSVDHTFIQEAIEAGLLTREEAKTHPHRHVVRRHLGGDPNVKPDFRLRLADGETPEQAERNQGLALQAGDVVLLCSDGLSDVVEANEIWEALKGREPQAAVDALIMLARQRGGRDNITVVVIQVMD